MTADIPTTIISNRSISFNGQNYTFSTKQFTRAFGDFLDETLAKERAKTSHLFLYPMKDDETKEMWEARVRPLVRDEIYIRKENETPYEQAVRANRVKTYATDARAMAFPVFTEICRFLKFPEIALEAFDTPPFSEVRELLFWICDQAEVFAPEFANPKSTREVSGSQTQADAGQ